MLHARKKSSNLNPNAAAQQYTVLWVLLVFIRYLLMHEGCQGSSFKVVHVSKRKKLLISSLVTSKVVIATAKGEIVAFFFLVVGGITTNAETQVGSYRVWMALSQGFLRDFY